MKIESTKYIFYMDDSGSRFPDRTDTVIRDDGMDHFALGGILIAEKDIASVVDKYKEFCKKWNINYPLHSTKIRGKRDRFAWLENSAKTNGKFLTDLQNFLISIPVIGFATVIHRPGYIKRYSEKYGDKRWWMCKTAFSVLIERVTKYVKSNNASVEIYFEEVGKREDRALIQYIRELKSVGMPFDKSTAAKYNSLSAKDFKEIVISEPRRASKKHIFIQIADLYLYPMSKRIYDPTYNPWIKLYANKKVIDAIIPECEWLEKGIKYSCFDIQIAKDSDYSESDTGSLTRTPGQSPYLNNTQS